MIAMVMMAMFLLPSLSHAQEACSDTLMKFVRTLASARYEGRLAGTEEYDDAANYVIETLSRYGVKPYQGEWLQPFTLESNKIENCTFTTYINDFDTRSVYVIGKDFACAGMTGRGYVDAQVVFCGYGIESPEYNDYVGVDARGKVVMCLTGVPNFLPSSETDRYATLRDKARAAQRHGALALVVVNMSKTCSANEVQGRVYSGELPHLPTFPILQTTYSAGERLLMDERMPLKETLEKINFLHKPQSYLLTKKFEIDVNATYHPKAKTANIVGIIEGEDPKLRNEYVVLSAHLDHVGLQGRTCLFPGANDGASGVAALMETARMIQATDNKPQRSVVIAIFSGSEQQHRGSELFVKRFKPLKNIEAVIDVECIGDGDSLAAMGNMRFPLIWQVVNEQDSAHTRMMVHGYRTKPKGEATAFANIGIPSVVISHYNGGNHDHVPSDIPENINRRLIANGTTLTYHTMMELCKGWYQGRSQDSRRVQYY